MILNGYLPDEWCQTSIPYDVVIMLAKKTVKNQDQQEFLAEYLLLRDRRTRGRVSSDLARSQRSAISSLGPKR